MKYDSTKSPLERMLELAEKYSKEGNTEKSEYWLNKATEHEERLNKQKENQNVQSL